MVRTPSLHKDLRVTNFIEGVYDRTTDGVTNKVIGALPFGAIPLPPIIVVKTAFNDTTPVFTVGNSASDDGTVTLNATSLATNTDTAPTATGYKTSALATLAAGFSNDIVQAPVNVVLNYSNSGNNGSPTGHARVYVPYYFPFGDQVPQ